MTTKDLLALLTLTTGHQHRPADGGFLFCHTPHVGEFAYLGRVYDPVIKESTRKWSEGWLHQDHPYFTFLSEAANGIRVANISLYGVIEQIDRSIGSGVGQPISLDYGNIVERPFSLGLGDLVIGGMVGWSSRGVFVMDRGGRVRLVHPLDASDVAAEWPDLEAMLYAELSRIAQLHDADGREISSATHLMHPEGRRWETEVEPQSGIH